MSRARTNRPSQLSWLVSPQAMGFYLTLAIAYVAFSYYQTRQNAFEMRHVFKVIHDIDQKSIDYRLVLRGPRSPDPRVAVLAVDDRSINKIGRWPWPRSVMAEALTAAFENGAKVIAADVVWSEPTDRPEVRFAQELSKYVALPEARVNELLNSSDEDKAFVRFLEKYKSQFILGAFFESPYSAHQNPIPPYATPCVDWVLAAEPLGRLHESQSRPFIVTDDREITYPTMLAETYSVVLSEIPTVMNRLEFCATEFLRPAQDPVAENLSKEWSALASEIFPDGTAATSFDEWTRLIFQTTLKNSIHETLLWTLNLPAISEAGIHHGYFNAKQDTDGTIRRAQLVVRSGSRYMPALALLAYLNTIDGHAEFSVRQLPKNLSQRGIEEFKIKSSGGDPVASLPVSAEGYLTINYAGRGHTIPHASMADLLDKERPTVLVTQNIKTEKGEWREEQREVLKKEFFKDKVFILGATAIAVYDLRVTPFQENFPGVETHANVVDNLLRQDFLFHHADEDFKMPLALLALGAFLTLSISYSGALAGLLLSIFCLFAIAVFDRFFLFSQGVVASVVFPIAQTGLTYMILTFYKYFTEERSKKELRQTFSKYVSPQIVEEV